ncbi:MAG TPA: LCP family protein [Chroococcidiopsis sp.]
MRARAIRALHRLECHTIRHGCIPRTSFSVLSKLVSNPKVKVFVSPSLRSTQPPKPAKKRRGLRAFLGLMGIAVTSATAGALLAVAIASTPLLHKQLSPDEQRVFNNGEPISQGQDFRLPQLTRPVNILVLGIKVLASEVNDAPEELKNLSYDPVVDSFDGLSDAMLLLRFNPSTGQLVVLSIPRDTRTRIEGLGQTKLNAANAYGGPALAATTVSDLLGEVPIDRYIRINVQGVGKLIDALGGVTVYVPQDMRYKDDTQHLYIDLKQGEQHLNGEQALQFLRFRYDRNGDIGRVQRQQTFMRAMVEQTLTPGTLARIPQIMSVVQDNVDTNLSIEELLALAGFASHADRSDVQMLMLPGDFSRPGQFDLSYWLPDRDEIDDLMSQYFDVASETADSTIEEAAATADSDGTEANPFSRINIAIQNSTGKDKAVDYAIELLNDAGFGYTYDDAPWNDPLTTTQIIAQHGDRRSAEAIRDALGVGEVRVESTGDLRSDVTIRLGQDWLQVRPVSSSVR